MTYRSLVQFGCDLLKFAEKENANFDAMCLLENAAATTKTWIKLHENDEVKIEVELLYKKMIRRRQKGEPLQYILGKWEFMGFEFYVGPGVLIPRPETEMLVQETVRKIHHWEKPVVFDLCAGTGCIGISVAKMCGNAMVYLVESSTEAIKILELNIRAHELENVQSVNGDIFDGFESFNLTNPDIILSNPPYIPTAEIPALQSEVLYEPEQALDGGLDGLEFYRAINSKWMPFLNPGGMMLVESGDGQADKICSIFSQNSHDIIKLNDLNNMPRIVEIRG